MGKEEKGKGDGPEDKEQEVVQKGKQRTGRGRGVTPQDRRQSRDIP